jgi:hypothetical protein
MGEKGEGRPVAKGSRHIAGNDAPARPAPRPKPGPPSGRPGVSIVRTRGADGKPTQPPGPKAPSTEPKAGHPAPRPAVPRPLPPKPKK